MLPFRFTIRLKTFGRLLMSSDNICRKGLPRHPYKRIQIRKSKKFMSNNIMSYFFHKFVTHKLLT